jgi:two-component system response regulator VanR
MSARKILVVDDSPLAIDMLRAGLEGAGFTVLQAVDLAEFEAHRANLDVDLVLMDVQMPELYGDDIAAVLRQLDKVTAPIYLYSSLEDSELRQRAAEAGIDGFITKREGIENVVARVEEILAGARRD